MITYQNKTAELIERFENVTQVLGDNQEKEIKMQNEYSFMKSLLTPEQ